MPISRIDRIEWRGQYLHIYADAVWCLVYGVRHSRPWMIDCYRVDQPRHERGHAPEALFKEAGHRAGQEFRAPGCPLGNLRSREYQIPLRLRTRRGP